MAFAEAVVEPPALADSYADADADADAFQRDGMGKGTNPPVDCCRFAFLPAITGRRNDSINSQHFKQKTRESRRGIKSDDN